VLTCWPIENGDEHQLQWSGSGEVTRRGKAALVMEAAMDQNTQLEFDSLRNF